MRTLYVMRHGEPAVTGVLLGRTDPPLSLAGIAACSALRIEAEIFYSSPLRRSRQSASAVAHGHSVQIDEDLIEIALGTWDGRTWSDIEAHEPELAAAKLADWLHVVPPGGEPWDHFTARVDRALERILSGPFPAAVVGHIAVNAWIAHRLAGDDPLRFTQPYAGVETYEL